jgi:alkylation response protein AidB-like acyl-CoA dehydrogenase
MDFSLSSEQTMMVDATRRMVAEDIEPVLAANDPDKPLPKPAALAILQAASRMGITAARLPQAEGGAGLSALDYGLICEQLPTMAAFLIQCQETAVLRLHYGSNPEQRKRTRVARAPPRWTKATTSSSTGTRCGSPTGRSPTSST